MSQHSLETRHKALGTPRVLIIAGSDSGGGAGIQGDLKTVTCLGAYGATAITALTAQNTTGVYGIHDVPPDFVRKQIELVLSDIGADAIKTGMLSSRAIIDAVADALAPHAHIPLVVDPVMVAKGGAPLLAPDAIDTLTRRLLPMAALLTPNTPEAELLTGISIRSVSDMQRAASALMKSGCRAVLLKGGHMEGDVITNVLMDENDATHFTLPRIATAHTHGTGCTLASAIATGLAQKLSLSASIERAQDYVSNAIANAPGLGKGHGPLMHNYMISENA